MTLLYVAAECEAVDRLSTTVIETAAGAASPDRCAIDVPQSQTMQTGPWLEGATCSDTAWVNFDWRPIYPLGTEQYSCYLYTTGPVPFFRFKGGGSAFASTVQPQTSVDGTTWVDRGVAFTLPNTVRYTLVVKVKLNSASGTVDVWVGDTHPIAVTGINLSAVADFGSWKWIGSSYGGDDFISKLIITANEDCRNYRLTPYQPTGNGANTAESGSYADVAELALDDSTAISFANNGDVGTFIHAATALPTNHVVIGVVVSSRVRKGATGIANYQHALRIGGTNYASASVAAPDTAYHPRQSLWTTDPSTSAAFLAVPTEFGGKGIT